MSKYNYEYEVEITCTFKRRVYGDTDAEALTDAKRFRVEHSNGYQVPSQKEIKIISKHLA